MVNMAPTLVGRTCFQLLILVCGIGICYGCGFLQSGQDLQYQYINEEALPDQPLRIPVDSDVTGVSCASPPTNSMYITCNTETDGTDHWVNLIPTDELGRFYDNASNVNQYITIPAATLTCSSGGPVTALILLFVVDENNRSPEFDTPSQPPDTVTLPYSQAPINWREPVIVKDKDCYRNNTDTTFVADKTDMIRIESRRVPASETERLEYYELYYFLQDDWDDSQGFDDTITITATNTLPGTAAGNLQIPLKIEASPDVIAPEIQEEPSYYATPMPNVVGETRVVASVSDDRDDSLEARLEGPFAVNFENPIPPGPNGEVNIRLTTEFTQDQLESNNHVIRVTLVVTDDAGNSNMLPLAIPFERDEAPAITEDSRDHNRLLRNVDGESTIVATVADESMGTLYPPEVSGNNAANFQADIDPSNGQVTITLTSRLDAQVLVNSNYVIRLTLKVTDSTNHESYLAIALLFERTEVKATVDNSLVVLEMGVTGNIATVTATPADDVTFSINPDDGKVAVAPDTGIITASYTDDDIVDSAGEVSIYTITASRLGGIAQSQVTFVLSFKPDESLIPTETPVTCPTTEAPVECTCPPTESPITCPATTEPAECTCPPTVPPTTCPTETPVTCPPTEAPVTCPVTTESPECTCPPTESPVTCPATTEPAECTCPPTVPPTTCPTETPVTCPPTEAPVTCPTTCPPTEAPVTCPPTEAPVTCPPTEAPVTCPTTCPPTEAPVTCPTTCPPTEAPVTCPTTCPPPEPCQYTTEATTACPVTEDPPVCNCSTTDTPVTCETTAAPPECPTTCPPPEPTTMPTCPECPTTCEPTVPTTIRPISTTCPSPPAPEPCDDQDCDCSTSGLIAGVAVASTIAVGAAGIAAFLAYKAWASGTLTFGKAAASKLMSTDPEFGNNGGSGGTTNNGFDNGTTRTNGINGSLKGSVNNSGSIAKSFSAGAAGDGAAAAAATTAATPLEQPNNLTYQNESSTYASPDYSYANPEPDITASELDQPATAETAKSKLAEDIPKTDDSSMPELPDADAEPPAEPEIDYKYLRINPEVETIPTEEIADTLF